MIEKIEFVSPASPCGVRNYKISKFLKEKGFELSFVGWLRKKNDNPDSGHFNSAEYLLSGVGESNSTMPLYYIEFIIKIFIKYLFSKKDKTKLLYAVNFEAAFALWLVSKFRNIEYCYDIWDELALSHNFPKPIKNLIRFFDKMIRKKSRFYIHVDPKRRSVIDSSNHIILYNSPYDIFIDQYQTPDYDNVFAVTGYFSDVRGLESIYKFAKDNTNIKFIVAGEFLNKQTERQFLSLKNVEYHHFMPQAKLFEIMKNCRGIFSLYDPCLEINKLAASNKLYDAMMLGIPVVVNNGIDVAKYVNDSDIGYIVNYEYDKTWAPLSVFDIQETIRKGLNGRNIYKAEFKFDKMCENVLLPELIKN